jgi:hypothetical protein
MWFAGLTERGWAFVHPDDSWAILMRTDQAPVRPEYRVIRPWANVRVTEANAAEVLVEANRALEECPGGASFAWSYKTNALLRLGREAEVLEAWLHVPEKLVIE